VATGTPNPRSLSTRRRFFQPDRQRELNFVLGDANTRGQAMRVMLDNWNAALNKLQPGIAQPDNGPRRELNVTDGG
jgi:hypothetical protein